MSSIIFASFLLVIFSIKVDANCCHRSFKRVPNGNCYLFGKKQVTIDSAEKRCKSKDGHLAIIETPAELKKLERLLQHSQLNDLWTNGRFDDQAGWTWETKSKNVISRKLWCKGQPRTKSSTKKSAAKLVKEDEKWCLRNDRPKTRHGYLCECLFKN